MARDVSIAISVKDNFTQAITTMKNANQAFNKDIEGLTNKLDALNKNKITLKVDTDKARKSLKEAEKAFADLGEAAGEKHVKDLEKANDAYEQSRRNLKLVADEARRTEKALTDYGKESSKAENRASSNTNSMLSNLAAAGAVSLLRDTGINITSGIAGSAFGSTGTTIFESLIAGAGSGAAVGTALGGFGIGTAIGGAVGGGLGLVNTATSLYTEKDDVFKARVEELYSGVKETEAENLMKGIAIAGDRERKQISFTTLLGSEDAANEYLDKLIEFDAKTPFKFDQLAEISRTLLAYGFKEEEMLPLLTKVGDAGSALGLSTDEINNIATSLGRMQITGQTTMRYLNPLLEKGIDVWSYLAKASGKTKEEVQDMVSKGLVPGEEAAKAIADYMGTDFAGNMEKQSKSYEGLLSSLEGAQEELENAMGKGYTDERKKGIEAQINWLDGESGEKMKEANRMIGEWQASLDNAREAAIRDSVNEMMKSDDYIDAAAANNRVEMGRLLAEAQARGENEYRASEGFQDQLKADKELVKKIRDDAALKDEYWETGYVMGKEFSKGRLAAVDESKATLGIFSMYDSYTPGMARGGAASGLVAPSKQAYGMNYVPYDNFPALLHQGERVLTASEARSANHSNSNVTITGNNFTVRQDSDIEEIAREIVTQFKRAAILAN